MIVQTTNMGALSQMNVKRAPTPFFGDHVSCTAHWWSFVTPRYSYNHHTVLVTNIELGMYKNTQYRGIQTSRLQMFSHSSSQNACSFNANH